MPQIVSERPVVSPDADPGRDADRPQTELLGRDPLAFGQEASSEPAVLPPCPRRIMDRHDPTDDFQLPDRRGGAADSESCVTDEHIAVGVFETQEDFEAPRRIVLDPEEGQGFGSGIGSPEAHLATADAVAIEALRAEALLGQNSQVAARKSCWVVSG